MQLRSIILLLSEILSELKALRKSVEEILRIQKGEDDSHADFISARKAAQILGIKTSLLRQIVGGYIELFRNTPLLVQLFFLYFALPKIGVRISAETCGKLGLGLLGGAAVSIFLSLQLSRQMFRPIGRLHDAISQVGQNDLQVQVAIEEDRRDELSELAQQFNRMVLSLRRNQQALLENQQALNDAQIRMLQAQLNPHFLCNTLDTMKWISKINQVPQVALMSTNLADILRFCILPDEFVPLEKELQILGRYVEIQRIRLSDSFTYEQTVPEALLSCMVPKMMLQPLAENAILHGLSGVPDGKLTVEARELEDETLEIRVCDNGAGLPEALLGPYRPPEKQTRHLGLFNVDTILKKHYGERFGLRLDNRTDGTGACITARLPVRRRDAE